MKKLYFLFALVYLLCYSAYAQYTELYNFMGPGGMEPYGDLFNDGTYLYGMTHEGGSGGYGTVFKIKPDGSSYQVILGFAGFPDTTNGGNPFGSLISDGTFLYGMTYSGGTNNQGVVFKIKPDGSGYIKLLNFAGVSNGNRPYGSLISDGTFLYGMTSAGGTNNLGTIFKIKPDGSGYTKLLDFAGSINGDTPWGSLFFDGTFLYGMTLQGGTSGTGTVFKIKPDGTGFLKLIDFTGATNGSLPYGSLYYDGTYLYGMTYKGGTSNFGTLFKVKPDGSAYLKLLDFSAITSGSYPYGSLIYDGTYLYGMTSGGNGLGTIFKIKTDGSGFSKLYDFMGFSSDGINPRGSLITDGTFLYGMTEYGGSANYGDVFKFALTIGIDELSDNKQSFIYPNPTSGSFKIKAPHLNCQLEIYNMLGEKIYSAILNGTEKEIELKNAAAGIYFVRVSDGEKVWTQKLVIE